MTRIFLSAFALCLLVSSIEVRGADPPEGFRRLFNERDLSHWVLVNTPPETWQVKDQMLICSGKPIGEIRTEKMYQNFILEVEWRHMVPQGNAGIFVWADDITARGVPFHRSIEVQVLENAYGNTRSHTTHGDIFPIHGAKMTPVNGRGGSRAFPTENRSKPSPEWNHYRIVCNDGNISLAVNGKVVTRGKDSSLRKGYICLESEGGVVHYRNLFIKEFPATPLQDDQVAIADRGYRSIYTGLDLSGWKQSSGSERWKSNDWVLSYTGVGPGTLETEESFSDFGFLLDVQRKTAEGSLGLVLGEATEPVVTLNAKQLPNGKWVRLEGQVRDGTIELRVNDQPLAGGPRHAHGSGPLRIVAGGELSLANLFVRE